MALSPQTSRAFKLLTIAATTATGFHCVFRTDYGDEEHCFSDLQRWYNARVDAMMGIDTKYVEAERRQRLEEQRRREEELRRRVEGAARRLGEELDDRPGGRGRKHGGQSLTEEVVARERR